MTLEKVLECLPELKLLAKTKSSKKRELILKSARSCLFYAISEIARNILIKNIPLTRQQLRKLLPYKKDIRNIAKKSISLKKRKHIINQSGGFLGPLLIPALTVLGNIAIDQLTK